MKRGCASRRQRGYSTATECRIRDLPITAEVAFYAGWPKVTSAVPVARQVFQDNPTQA